MIGIDYRAEVGFVKLYCADCDLCMAADKFARRTPGPATAKLAAWFRGEITMTPRLLAKLQAAFIAEHEPKKEES
jgi:hypothetical protein